jgi:hypothetical protein
MAGVYRPRHPERKAGLSPLALRMSEEELKPVLSKGWAAMIWKVYEVDPLTCPKCGGMMKIGAFLTDFSVVDRIIEATTRPRTGVAERNRDSRLF